VADENAQLAFDLFPDERWIQTPQQYGAQLHDGGMGTVAIGQKTARGGWRESVYPVEVAVELLNHYRGKENVYLSTQRFRGRRRIAKLLSLSSLYADLDFYRFPELDYLHPYMVLELALEHLERAAIPPPTLAISSGRGLYLVWQHEHLKRSALPRWNRCHSRLVEVLEAFGADAQARDAARVLRVVGTLNREETVYSLLSVGEVYGFGALADRILPFTQAELYELRIQRALRAPKRPHERLFALPKGYDQGTLWEARLSDLQRLRELRFFDSQMTDYRHRWLFLSGVAMSWLATSPRAMQRELYELAREAGSWSEEYTAGKLASVVNRTYAAFRGEHVEWRGWEFDPRYRYSNQRIIELLEVTSEEEREMKTIISEDERRQRDREEKQRERREAGMMSREQYEGRAAERRREAPKLRSEGRSVKEIAAVLGVSERRVKQLLKGSRL
jgi:hypothetical protein